MVIVLEVRHIGGKGEVQANKVSMAALEVGTDVDLEAARGDVEGNEASGDGTVVITKDAGDADEPKEAFAIEMFPVIGMGSREDAVVAEELALINGKRRAAEDAG